jgi:hypothetical protein
LQIGTCTLSAAFCLSNVAQAQLGASPLIIEAAANQGQSQALINIINTSNAPLRARIYTEPFTYNRDAGFQTLPSIPNYLGPYLQFSPRELTVPPGVSRRVRLMARLAPNLPDGEYRAVVFTETLNDSTNSNGKRVGVLTRVGTTVYIRKGNISANLVVDSAKFDNSQKQIQLLVHNSGSASVRPSISWTLNQGEKVVITGKSDLSVSLAQNERNFALNISDQDKSQLTAGNYQLIGNLTWSNNHKKTTLPFKVNLSIPGKI